MSLLARLRTRLDIRLDRAKRLELQAVELQARVESVEDLLNSNAILVVAPEHLEDTIRVIRRGLTATNNVHPVVIALLVRWCHEKEGEFLQGDAS